MARMLGGRAGKQWYGGPVRARRPANGRRARRAGGRRGAVRCSPVWKVVPPVARRYPGSPIDAARQGTDHFHMEVIQPARAIPKPSMAPLLAATAIATILIVAGIVMAFVVLATPALTTILPTGRLNIGQMATGMLVWALALVGPAAFVLLGANRLLRILTTLKVRNPPRTPLLRALDGLPDGMVVAHGLTLADGRGVSELVLGPFGAAVLRELPPAAMTRIREGQWELRTPRGWIQLENPLDRAARDAERVRRWLGHDDADFVVKVYAAVVGTNRNLTRTTDCAVISPDEAVAWISALPPQRSLTEGRRGQVLDMVREAIGAPLDR